MLRGKDLPRSSGPVRVVKTQDLINTLGIQLTYPKGGELGVKSTFESKANSRSALTKPKISPDKNMKETEFGS